MNTLIDDAKKCMRAMSDDITEAEAACACDGCRIRQSFAGEICDGINGPNEIIKRLVYSYEDNRTADNADRSGRVKILRSAESHVCGDRDHDYGGPENSFSAIARLWNAYIRALTGEYNPTVLLKPYDVAAMMILLKVARIPGAPGKNDTWEDIAGYAACGGEIAEEGAT